MLFMAFSPLSGGGAELREPWGAAMLWEMWESVFAVVGALILVIVQLILAKPSPGSTLLAFRMALLYIVAQASFEVCCAACCLLRAACPIKWVLENSGTLTLKTRGNF